MKHIYRALAIVGTLTVGVSCGLPLYLYLEARQAQALADNAEPRDD